MKYKIAICDDSDIDREYLTQLLNRWAEKEHHSIQISDFSQPKTSCFITPRK